MQLNISKNATGILNKLRNKYYEQLENDCIPFIEYEDIGEGYFETRVKDKYAQATVEEMVLYLYGDSWIGDWTKLNIGEN